MTNDEGERNALPEKKWAQVAANLKSATDWHEKDELDEAIGYLIDALGGLYSLLEPPSVRERRLNDGG